MTAEEYAAHVDARAALCIAFSAADAATGAAWMAVGGRGSRVFLWRVEPGEPAPDLSPAALQAATRARMQAFGTVLVTRSRDAWVTSLAFALAPGDGWRCGAAATAAPAVLFAGLSDGRLVRLDLEPSIDAASAADMTSAAATAAVPADGACLPLPIHIGMVTAPDLSPVTCLVARRGGDGVLWGSAGKANGSLLFWRGPGGGDPSGTAWDAGRSDPGVKPEPGRARAPGNAGVEASCPRHACHTTVVPDSMEACFPVTGLAWSSPAGADSALDAGRRAEQATQCLISVDRQGSLCRWVVELERPTCSGGGGGAGVPALVVTKAPGPVTPPGCVPSKGWGAFGLAASGNGLYVATLRLARHPATELVKCVSWAWDRRGLGAVACMHACVGLGGEWETGPDGAVLFCGKECGCM